MTRSEFEQKCYDAYKLDWMLSHGYTLRDYLDALINEDEEASAEGIYPEGDTRDIFEYLDSSFEYETGFPGGTIWACKDEFLGAEFKDIDYMEHLISLMPNSKEMEDFWRVMYGISKEVKFGDNRKKQPTDIWNGEDIYISYNEAVLLIAEGSGDNLTSEDEDKGYVDYFNLELYEKDDRIEDLEDYDDTVGGGFMMRKKLISEELYGKMIDEVVAEVFRCNGDTDAFELYATSKPDYEILN